MKRLWQASLVLILLGFPSACSMVEKRKAIKNCDFTIQKVKFEDTRMLSATAVVTLEIYNPNAIEVVVDKLNYRLFVEAQCLVEGSNLQQLVIPSQETRPLEFRAEVNYLGAYKTIRHVIKEKSASYQLKGTVYLTTLFGDIPFDLETKVYRLP